MNSSAKFETGVKALVRMILAVEIGLSVNPDENKNLVRYPFTFPINPNDSRLVKAGEIAVRAEVHYSSEEKVTRIYFEEKLAVTIKESDIQKRFDQEKDVVDKLLAAIQERAFA